MKVLKTVLCLLYIGVGVELFFRAFNPIPMLPRYIEAKEYGVRGNMGDAAYWHKTPDYKVHIRMNSEGMRSDEEFSFEKPEGIKRILLLGDSFGVGYGVDISESFTTVCKNKLEEEGFEIQIINLATSGHGNAEELITLQNEGLKYQPDLILLQFHSTDYADNTRSLLFELKNDSLVRKKSTYLPAVALREKLFSYPVYRWLAGNCHSYNWLREEAGMLTKRSLALLRSSGDEQETAEDNSLPVEIDHQEEDLTFEILDKIKTVGGENKASLLIFEVPGKSSRIDFSHPITPYLSNRLRKNNIHIISPMDKFKDYHGQIIYWERSQGHFTPLGCLISGKEIAKYILQNDLL